MKPIAFEFRCAQIRHPDDPEKRAVAWMMELTGKIDGIGHKIRSNPIAIYPSKRELAQHFTRMTRQMRDWFDGPDYEEAQKRAERHPHLLVIPGRV